MHEYSVTFTVGVGLDGETADDLLGIMNDLGYGSVLAFGNTTYSPAFTVADDDHPLRALEQGYERLTTAAEKAGIAHEPIVKIEMTDWHELEAELERPAHPAVLGIAELAEILGVSRQRASQVARINAFPKPYAELASGPVWFSTNVERFVQEWERKPGRPRKQKASA
jgi:hypothetical protein